MQQRSCDFVNSQNEVPAGLVRAHLAHILQSDMFARSRRMQRFLEFIVEEALEGRSHQIGEYSIGVAVFDRGQDFEPMLDPIVRNDARRLRFKLLEYYRQSVPGDSSEVMIEIPKGGYVPVFRLRTESPMAEPKPAAALRRVAVFPFEVLSDGQGSDVAWRALSLSLTARLTNCGGLDAVAQDCLDGLTLREAASELHLSHAVRGSIFQIGRHCRVIVSLLSAACGTQLWAGEYDAETGASPNFQSEIAHAVTKEVTARLNHSNSKPEIRLLARAA